MSNTSPFNQTAIMMWQHGNSIRVHISDRFGDPKLERRYTPTPASLDRLMALPQLTADWPTRVNVTFGSIFVHYTIEDESRDLERAKHTYRGPSAITEGERDLIGTYENPKWPHPTSEIST